MFKIQLSFFSSGENRGGAIRRGPYQREPASDPRKHWKKKEWHKIKHHCYDFGIHKLNSIV